MLLAYGSIVALLLIIILISYLASSTKTIGSLVSSDLIPITGGTKKAFIGGILTYLYLATIATLVSGVIVRLIIPCNL